MLDNWETDILIKEGEFFSNIFSSKKQAQLYLGGALNLERFKNLEFLLIDRKFLFSGIYQLKLGKKPNLEKIILFGHNFIDLDISNCPNLVGLEVHSPLKQLDVSNNPKLTDLFINAELFYPENKIIGLEKTSIVRLDCQGGSLLSLSQDPQFIWEVFIRKYNVAFPEMKLINVDDLTELAKQVNEETIKDDEFLRKFCNVNFIRNIFEKANRVHNIYWVLDNIANQIFARCMIIQNRLYTDEKDESYEKHLIELAQNLNCRAMNPKYPKASLYSTREKLVNQALNGDKELLQRIVDLSYVAEWVEEKLEEGD